MRPSVVLDMKRSAVREAVGRFRAANPRVFGSVLHGTDRDGSDLDLLVDALPGAKGGSSRHAHRQLHDRTTARPASRSNSS